MPKRRAPAAAPAAGLALLMHAAASASTAPSAGSAEANAQPVNVDALLRNGLIESLPTHRWGPIHTAVRCRRERTGTGASSTTSTIPISSSYPQDSTEDALSSSSSSSAARPQEFGSLTPLPVLCVSRAPSHQPPRLRARHRLLPLSASSPAPTTRRFLPRGPRARWSSACESPRRARPDAT